MSTRNMRKYPSAATDIGGVKSSRYEKLQVTYGVIPAGGYALGDVLTFDDIPANDVIGGKITALTATPTVLDINPATVLTGNLSLAPGVNNVAIGYEIRYIRGTGSVGGNGPGDVLKVAIS